MSNYNGLVKRLLAGPWERHTDTGRVADDAPLDAAAAIMEMQTLLALYKLSEAKPWLRVRKPLTRSA